MLIIMKLIIVILQCVLFGILVRAGGPNFDNCDWNGSGTLEMALSRGVQPVYLRCNQGTVRWSYPQGALRVALQQRGGHGAQFSACVRRGRGSSGARLFVAGAQRLSRVFAPRDHPDMVRCVAAVGGQVTLYVEADPIADSLRRTAAEFSYHLKRADVVDEECQPCTESQLLHQYCSSDFVFQGSVTSLYHDKPLEVTELTVRVSKTHRANEIAKFPRLPSDPGKETPKYVVLQRPLRCGTKAGSGEYIFMGKWVLGNPTLGCVPRLSEWKKVRRKALESGKNECLLST